MIFCETRNIGWSAVRNIWLNTLSEHVNTPAMKELIVDLFDWLFPMMTYFVTKNCRMPTTMAAQELIFCQTRLLRCLLDFDDGVASDLPKAVEGCFLFSMIWSVGACVDGEGRRKFDLFFRAVLAGQIEQSPEYLDFKIKNPDYEADPTREAKVPVPVGEGEDVYSFFFDGKQARWINWLENRPVFKIPADAKFNAIMVPTIDTQYTVLYTLYTPCINTLYTPSNTPANTPQIYSFSYHPLSHPSPPSHPPCTPCTVQVPTIDTIRNEWLVEKLLVKGYHVMATGDTGTGKSLSIKNKLLSGMPEKFNAININFSAQTTANQTQDLIDSKLDKRRKGVLGPPLGMVTVVFLGEHPLL